MTTLPDVSHYCFRVQWSAEDHQHVATALEFPSLSWLADDPVGALVGLRDLVDEVVADLHQARRPYRRP